MRPLQNLYGLATANGQLVAVASREVMDHYGQLTATRKLGGTEKERQVSKKKHWDTQGCELGQECHLPPEIPQQGLTHQ